MPIRKLPTLLVNQIAAGEVIERPASVVKELVENSLDAGASHINVAVEEGGRQLIRIADDGTGIPPQELPLALAPHATSKLQSAEQLAAIRTLGFRGEALASIASVSRLRLTSRATRDGQAAEAGAGIEASGDVMGSVAPVACAPGTVVEVRDLFFNTPARRKFMRSAGTEFGHIADLVGRIAMVHPEVGFTLVHNGRTSLDLPAVTAPRQRVVAILGGELDEALLEFTGEWCDQTGGAHGDMTAWGLAGLPAIARATAKFQYLYVNHRPVRDRNLQHAVKEAYRGLMMPDLQPVVAVFLQMPFDQVDVNVHPAKSEVRFADPSRVHGLVLTAVRQRLLGADLTPSAGVKQQAWKLSAADALAGAAGDEAGPSGPAASGGASGGGTALSADSFVDYFKRMAPVQKGFVFEEVKKALAQEDPSLLSAPGTPPGISPGELPRAAEVRTQPILQVHNSYVVTQDEDGLVIIDQHALHERIMFEELSARILGQKKLESQRLLMPAVLNLSPKRAALLEDLKPLLDRIGIEAEPIGPAAMGVQAFPTFLFDRQVDPVEFLTELLDRAEEGEFDNQPPLPQGEGRGEGGTSGQGALGTNAPAAAVDDLVSEAILHKVLDMMACKAAVKAGDRLTPQELAALLARRQEIERSSSCPHGRPTAIRLTLHDLEKQFKRIL